ncbi:hypothetical protein [Tatumella ptyseos]|uniref:hypothetical protein n=1 Tax=Tatumella ptyseos TaxID=82987 RepID=UPI0026EB93B6|nr:hypothetical protein [Tatumella ptyseos]WKX25409.1 hypothetical protein QJR74_08660 [Tatumella ptyseos]
MKDRKLKSHFTCGRRPTTQRFARTVINPQLRSHIFRYFSTFAEKKATLGHMADYPDYRIPFRACRGKNIIDYYDDIPTDVLKLSRSWKHNSRRKKQFYR